jgi:hypothetical protein
MEGIWAGQKAREHHPRGTEEVEAERRALREGLDEEIFQAIRLQEENRRLREQEEPKGREKK